MISAANRGVMRIDPETGSTSDFLVRPGWTIYDPRYSPDGKWLLFSAGVGIGPSASNSRFYIVRLEHGSVPPPASWILAPVGDEQSRPTKVRWSPDGDALYYLSQRDGFRCLWTQRVQPATITPVDSPVAIYHFHESRLSTKNVGLVALEMDVAADKVVITLSELAGNIWMLRGRR